MQSYDDKAPSYFSNARMDIARLLPEWADHVLEVGCGAGATLAWLTAGGRVGSTTGIELFEAAADRARQAVDRVLCGPAEQMILQLAPSERFDLVLCLDVLEHMVDPWSFLRVLEPHIRPGGMLIASLPNVRYVGVLLPLLFAGRWQYRNEGVLDRTHLRFFTRSSARELLENAGLKVKACVENVPARYTRVGRLHRYTFGLFSDFLAYQHVLAATKGG